MALAVPAIASAVNEPPVLPHSIISFPQRDFVSAAGFQASDSVTINVIRNGVTIGTSDPITPQDDTRTSAFDGIVEVNHPGGGCWLTTTPDILPGDVVRTTVQGSGVQDQTTTANVTADAPTNPGPGTVVITGSAQSSSGKQLPIDQVEQRLVANKDLFDLNDKRDLRAGAGGQGTLVYDSPTSIHFTATYTGLGDADVARAMGAESRTLWLGANAGTGQEGTIYENGAAGGPAAPCAAPPAVNGVTSSDHAFDGRPTVNLRNADTDLGLSGFAQDDATAVQVQLSDAAGASTSSVSGTLSGGASGQTWKASISAADVAGLADGSLTAKATFTTPGGTIGGSTLSLRKDTVAPGDPAATPGPGTYRSTQAVSLRGADPGVQIHYTVDGTAPTAASPVAPSQISVTSSLTIRTIAIDPAGNESATKPFAYLIEAPATNTGGGAGAGTGTGGGTPAAGGGTTTTPTRGTVASSSRPTLSLTSLGMAARVKQSKARKLGFRVTMRVPDGTVVVRIRVYRKTGKGLRLLSDGYRTPAASGLFRVRQNHLQLRRQLKRGAYELQVAPGYSTRELGVTSKVSFKVV